MWEPYKKVKGVMTNVRKVLRSAVKWSMNPTDIQISGAGRESEEGGRGGRKSGERICYKYTSYTNYYKQVWKQVQSKALNAMPLAFWANTL